MNNPVISVVMPAFNAAEYVQESVQSILEQTFSNIELIIVDDCSTDDTWKIISNIGHKDSRCRVFRMEENSGSAKYPRDMAVSLAQSNLICWIDSDDKIAPDYLEKLHKKMTESGSDLVCSKMIAYEDKEKCCYTLPKEGFDYDRIWSGKEAVMLTIGIQWQINMNGCLVKKDIWKSTSYYLNRRFIHMNADDFASREMILNAQKVASVSVPYYYRIHSQAITKMLSYKLFEPLITDNLVTQLIEKHFGEGSKQVNEAWNQYFLHWISMMRIYAMKNHQLTLKGRNIALGLLKEHKHIFRVRQVLKSQKLSLNKKILLLLPLNISMVIFKKINS